MGSRMSIVKFLYYLTRPIKTSPTRDSTNTDPYLNSMNLTTVETVLVSEGQPRMVWCIHSPTGTSLLHWRPIAHWVVVVGDLSSEDGVVTSEMDRDGDEVIHVTKPNVKLPSELVERAVVMGYTRMTDEEISYNANAWIESHPTYRLRSSNCQHFAKDLAQAIIDPALGVDPNPGVQYRFKDSYLRFVSTFQHSGNMAGWIMPTRDTILVNVTRTNDADVWTGQVDGTGDAEKFFKWSVERV